MKPSILITLIGTLLLCCCQQKPATTEATHAMSVDSLPMLIMQIQKCSRLYTAEYNIHKIVTHNDDMRIKGKLFSKDIDMKMPVGDRKIAIPIDVRLKAYIDFSQFSEKNVERKKGHITIILPDPQVELTASKIDQKHVKEYVAVTRSRHTDEEMADYAQQGRQAIINSIPELGIVETARMNAANLLIPMLQQMGYDERQITVTFRRDFNPGSIGARLQTIERTNR